MIDGLLAGATAVYCAAQAWQLWRTRRVVVRRDAPTPEPWVRPRRRGM